MLIEQAIFASAQTDRAEGYQLLGRTRGLADSEAQQLSLWGPSHDSLLDNAQGTSVNFFRLASGRFCVSRTTQAGAEYSGRGQGVRTHFLVVPTEVFVRFGNNPFAILRAATACGAMQPHGEVPQTLDPLRLGGRCGAVDLALLAQLARTPGAMAMATLVETALASDRLAIASAVPAQHLIAGLFSVLPIECRPEFSFASGLKASSSRPLRILSLPGDRAVWRGLDGSGYTLLNLDDRDVAVELRWEGWAGLVTEVLSTGKLSFLASQLEQRRPELNCANLPLLSQQLEAAMTSSRHAAIDVPPAAAEAQPVAAHIENNDGGSMERRADGAHVRQPDLCQTNNRAGTVGGRLAHILSSQPPEVVELLERIDDLVFAAMNGDQRALSELQVLWPITTNDLDAALVEQSREQYLRCALSIWTECVDGHVQRPERAVAAIDVLSVLFDE